MQPMPYYQQQSYPAYQPQQQNVLNNAPPMMPTGLPPMQHAGVPDPSQQLGGSQTPKRKQVKNACTNCQKACKKCDDARPCPRCIKYGIADTCINSVRKERKKGIKRGPYKRRQKTGEEKPPRKNNNTVTTNESTEQPNPYAMRAMPFGYPGSFGQHYDPYGQYYHKDQLMPPQPYVVNPVYPPMPGYPVIVPGGNDQQQQQTQQHYQHYMIQQQQQQQPPSTSRYEQQQTPVGSPQVYYPQQQNHSHPPSQKNSPQLPDVKLNNTQSEQATHFTTSKNMTPSTSTSTATASSPDSSSWNPPRSSLNQ